MTPNMILRTKSGLEAFGQTGIDGSLRGLGIEVFEGWGPVELQDRDVDRLGDGVFSRPARRRARFVTAGGVGFFDSWGDVEQAQSLIASLPTEGDVLTVEELGVTRWVTAGVRGNPHAVPDYRFNRPALGWEVTWKCSVHKFGEARSTTIPTGSSGQVVNRGLFPVFPTAVVTGPVSAGWSILGFTVNRSVASGEKITVDSESGSVSSSTAGELMSVVTGYPIQAPRGVSAVTFQGSGSGSAVVTVTDCF